MLFAHVFLAVLASCQLAWGFFPWFNKYRCIKDQACINSDSKRSNEAGVERDVVNALKLVQRLPQDHSPHEAQVRRLANRLTRKYQRGSPVQDIDEDELEKRDNIYNIVTAAKPTQTNSAGIDQDGSDYSYFAEVSLGTSSTVYHMLLDTGAGQTWVMGDTCTSAPCKTHNTFGPSDSTTYKAVANDFKIAYGTGDVSGMQVTDDIAIAGMKLSMTFGVANSTSNQFSSFPIDGILGLNQQQSQTPNFLQVLVSSKVLKANIFGVALSRSGDGSNTGAINFGQLDTSKFSGSLSYTSVSTNSQNDWAIPLDNLGVGSKKTDISNTMAYIDTGTSFIFCDEDEAKTFHGLISGATVASDGVTWYVPCTTTDSAFFTFSGVTYQVSSEDWVGPQVNGRCTSNIYGHAVVAGAWLLGDTFLKNVYAVFDVDQNRVGFAPTKSAVTSSTASSSSPTGGPSSISSSAALPSSSSSPSASAGSATTGTISVLGTSSNGTPTGSSSSTAGQSTTTPAASSGTDAADSSTPTGSPGLNGHQTMDSSDSTAKASATTASSSTTPSATPKSDGIRLGPSLSRTIIALVCLFTLS